jgi:hypothetical protein
MLAAHYGVAAVAVAVAAAHTPVAAELLPVADQSCHNSTVSTYIYAKRSLVVMTVYAHSK